MARRPSSLHHPSHYKHKLHLISASAYTIGSFTCNACGYTCSSDCYHCSKCNFKLHTICAFRSDTINHPCHIHPLMLEVSQPMNFRPINCDLCNGAVNNSYWYYRCSSCDYDAHLGCADTINLPGHSQESRLPSTGPVIQQPPLLQVASPANFLNGRQGMTSNFLNNLFGSIGRRTRDAIMEVVTAEASDAHENNVNFYHHHGGVNNYEDDGSHQPPGSSGWGSLDTFSGGGDDNGG